MAHPKRPHAALEREYRLAEHLFARGDVRRALPHFRRALLLDPESLGWKLRTAQCLERLGRFDESYQELRRMFESGIGMGDAALRREILQVFTNLCHRLNRGQEVIECIEAHRDVADDTPPLLYNLGLALYKCERFDDARACFERLKTVHPNHSAGYIGLAILHCRALRHDLALEELQAGRRASPQDVQVVENLALVQMKMGNPLGAVTVLRAASHLPAAVRSAKYTHLLGMAHLRLGELVRAEQHLRRSLALEKSADALRDIGWLMVAKGNYAESIDYLKEALVINPADVWAKVDLAIAYFKQGVTQDAQAIFNELRSESSQIPEVNKLLDDLARLIALSSPR